MTIIIIFLILDEKKSLHKTETSKHDMVHVSESKNHLRVESLHNVKEMKIHKIEAIETLSTSNIGLCGTITTQDVCIHPSYYCNWKTSTNSNICVSKCDPNIDCNPQGKFSQWNSNTFHCSCTLPVINEAPIGYACAAVKTEADCTPLTTMCKWGPNPMDVTFWGANSPNVRIECSPKSLK